MITSAFAHQSRGSPTKRTLVLTLATTLGVGLFLTGCSPDTAVEPSARANAPELAELASSAGCRYSDNQATKTRTVTSACRNTGVRVPKGWSVRVQRSDQQTKPRAGAGTPRVDPKSITTMSITTIPNPDAAYLSTTNKVDISSLADFSTHTSVSNGTQTFSFSTTMEKRQVPGSWGTWSSPPESESATPAVLFTQGVNSLTLSLTRPASIVGFELETNSFDVFTFTVDFYAGAVLLGSVIQDISGNAGARLLAGRSDGALIDGAIVSVSGDPGGFAIAQLRYSPNNSWAARAPVPTGRRGIAVATANGILYAIGGTNSAGAAVVGNQGYNPSTNTWSPKARLPAARQNGNGAATISGNIYVAGGQNAAGTLTRTLYRYNATTNVWSTRASMPVVGGCGGSAVISGRLYVFSGCTRSSTGVQVRARLLHRYTPGTNSWATLRAAPAVHSRPAVAAIRGRLYVIGGNSGTGGSTNRVDVYNPASNTWATVASMPTVRAAMAGVAAAGKIYVIGGRNGTTYLRTVQAYDPVANSWAARAPLPTARAELGAGVISGLIYAVGGLNGSGVLATNERYIP
jgi:N-acetylneuraminic acid mutarotase